MTKEVFEKLYFVTAEADELSDEAMESFVMDSKAVVGGLYFAKLHCDIAGSDDLEVVENVAFVEFDSAEKLSSYIDSRGRDNVIDWSFGFEKPCVLEGA